MISSFVEQFLVVMNATFPRLQWNVDTQNNTIIFRVHGLSLLTLLHRTMNISIIRPTAIVIMNTPKL